jgi:hypothetical protein
MRATAHPRTEVSGALRTVRACVAESLTHIGFVSPFKADLQGRASGAGNGTGDGKNMCGQSLL